MLNLRSVTHVFGVADVDVSVDGDHDDGQHGDDARDGADEGDGATQAQPGLEPLRAQQRPYSENTVEQTDKQKISVNAQTAFSDRLRDNSENERAQEARGEK